MAEKTSASPPELSPSAPGGDKKRGNPVLGAPSVSDWRRPITFAFGRHGIFLEYGVSRGHPKNGIRRSKSDWFSASLDRQQQKLLNIVSEHQADKYLHTFMGIKK